MNALVLAKSSLPEWQLMIAPVIGLAAAGLALFVGKVVGTRRQDKKQVVEKDAGDPFVYGSTSERRSSIRRKGNPVEVQLADPDGKESKGNGWVIDRSIGGLCVLVEQPLEQGTVLSLKPVNAPLGAMWVQVEVRSCRLEGKSWELGCRFVRTPPWSVLLLFG